MAADISPFIKDAQYTQQTTGIPASIVLGQIILESSGKYEGGLSGLAAAAKNLFGVKGKGSAGTYYIATKEFVNGAYQTVQAGFRKYNSYSESIADHAALLQKERYAKQFANAKTVEDYANGLQKAGYATSPTYASSLLNVIKSYNLTQYDTGNTTYRPGDGIQELHSGYGETANGSTGGTSSSGDTSDVDRGFAGNLVFTINRIILILLIVVVGIVFFMKAFPATNTTLDTATNVISPTKKLKVITGGGKKKGGRKKA